MNRPWMPLYVADFLADTAHLDAAQSGAYLHLMMHYWANGGLPDDDRQLARIAKMTASEWRRARPTVQAFFQDGWKHKRIEFELTEAARISAAGRAGGVASGEARRQRKPNDLRTTVERPLNDCAIDQPAKPEALQPPSPSLVSKKDAPPAPETSSITDDAGPADPAKSGPEQEFFLRSRKIFGPKHGGSLGAKLLKAKDGKIALARAALEIASTKQDPREYVGAIIRGSTPDESRYDGRI